MCVLFEDRAEFEAVTKCSEFMTNHENKRIAAGMERNKDEVATGEEVIRGLFRHARVGPSGTSDTLCRPQPALDVTTASDEEQHDLDTESLYKDTICLSKQTH